MATRRKRIGALAVAIAAGGILSTGSWLALRDTGAVPAAVPATEGTSRPGEPGADFSAVQVRGASPGQPGAAPRGIPGDGQAADEERREGEEIASGMAKLVRDLEWSPGQKEPPQQVVQPQPDPWRPDPTREGPAPVVEEVVPARAGAAGGGRAVIRGRNLRVVQVMFGASPAPLLAASGSEVIVEIPPGAIGPATVAVTNDDGTWAVATEPFVYGE